METEKFREKIQNFDRTMEPQRPMFKFAKELMKFVAFILMVLSGTREGNWKLHLESLKALCKYSARTIVLTMHEWYHCTWHK